MKLSAVHPDYLNQGFLCFTAEYFQNWQCCCAQASDLSLFIPKHSNKPVKLYFIVVTYNNNNKRNRPKDLTAALRWHLGSSLTHISCNAEGW